MFSLFRDAHMCEREETGIFLCAMGKWGWKKEIRKVYP